MGNCQEFIKLLITVDVIVNGQFPGYANLSTKLPFPSVDPITAVYQDILYLISSNRFFKLNLTSLDLTLNSDQNDIETQNVGTWQELNVSLPTYGIDGQSISFQCQHQCSAVIGKYLYIVAPALYASASSTVNYMYRLDLSQDPPVFASNSDFNANVSYTTYNPYGMCVTTDGNNLYYVTGRYSGTIFLLETWKYVVATDTHIQLMNVDRGRQNAGCAFNNAGSKLYLFGGRGLSPYTFGVTGIDHYNIYGNNWTNTSYDPYLQIYRKDRWKCFRHKHQNLIECPSGQSNIGTMKESIIWDPQNQSIKQMVTNIIAVREYGLINYQISNNASIVFILGGVYSSSNTLDIIQYAVRTATMTTELPTITPTTHFPTTVMPTINPITSIPTTSHPATSMPTTSNPTTSNPTTLNPTSSLPTTSNPITSNPTTSNPTSSNPTTSNPTTSDPTTSNPTSSNPTTSNPTTSNPSSSNPSSSNPSSSNPTTSMSTMHPTTWNPTTSMPSTSTTGTATSSSTTSTTLEPTTVFPTTSNPTTSIPTTSNPTGSNCLYLKLTSYDSRIDANYLGLYVMSSLPYNGKSAWMKGINQYTIFYDDSNQWRIQGDDINDLIIDGISNNAVTVPPSVGAWKYDDNQQDLFVINIDCLFSKSPTSQPTPNPTATPSGSPVDVNTDVAMQYDYIVLFSIIILTIL